MLSHVIVFNVRLSLPGGCQFKTIYVGVGMYVYTLLYTVHMGRVHMIEDPNSEPHFKDRHS